MTDRRTEGPRLGGFAVRLAGRVALALLVGLGTILFAFLALEMARGTPFGDAIGRASQEVLDYVGRLAHGNLGMTQVGASSVRRIPVVQALSETLPRSLGLLGVALGFSTLAGIFLGTLAATANRNLGASFLLFCSMLGASTPSFFLALLLQLLVLAITRSVGRSILPVGGFGWGLQLVLPALVLAARPVSQIARITFIRTREALGEDFVRTARAKGVGRWRVLNRHVARNVAVPVLTTAAVSLRFALASLPIVEVYFAWPGAGLRLLRAISDRDANLTVALLLSLALLFYLVQVLLELAYPALDPRLASAPLRTREAPRRLRVVLAGGMRWARSAPLQALQRLRKEFSALAQRRPRRTRARAAPRRCARFDVRSSVRRVNPALVIGGLVCLAMLVIVFFGARLAPHSPYLMAGVEKADGVYRAPPFAPSARFPWGTDGLGRDLMSLVLTGAQRTLLLAAVAVAFRVAVGVVLGAVAGWWRGSIADRMIVGLAQIITPFPILLLTMLVIMAVGIRQGTLPFVVGLCVVGWGEIAQFARAEVVSLKARPFVESARAVGVGTPRLVAAHLVPQFVPSLTALVAIEFSSVLMLLAELGFLGIFLGGGSSAEVNAFSPLTQYSDIPEWGALLANFRQSARAYPWLVLYPSLALFVSSFGFHLLGEGIRREIERGHLALRRVFNRYTLAGTAVGGLVLYFLSGNLGPAAIYQKSAMQFDGQRAAQHVEALAMPELGGHQIGSLGAAAAAEYIAQEFKRLGLQPVGDAGSYFLATRGGFERLTEVPTLTLDDGGRALRYEVDFSEYGDRFRCMGEGEGAIRFVSFGTTPSTRKVDLSEFKRVDLSKDVILVLSREDADVLEGRACGVVLVVASDPRVIEHGDILSPESRLDPTLVRTNFASTVPDRASFWVSEETAERILSGSGWTLASLRHEIPKVGAGNPLTFILPCRAAARAVGVVQNDLPVCHVVGWVSGADSASSNRLASQVVVVLAQYDTSPGRPGESANVGANDNASGTAVVLELARLLTQTEYKPNRSILFVAYSGTGWDGGTPQTEPSSSYFLSRLSLPARFFTVEAAVRLRALLGGGSSRLGVAATGGVRLANLFRSAAARMGTSTTVAETTRVGDGVATSRGVTSGPEVTLSYERWRGALAEGGPASSVSSRAMERAGEAAALGLMILGREREY